MTDRSVGEEEQISEIKPEVPPEQAMSNRLPFSPDMKRKWQGENTVEVQLEEQEVPRSKKRQLSPSPSTLNTTKSIERELELRPSRRAMEKALGAPKYADAGGENDQTPAFEKASQSLLLPPASPVALDILTAAEAKGISQETKDFATGPEENRPAVESSLESTHQNLAAKPATRKPKHTRFTEENIDAGSSDALDAGTNLGEAIEATANGPDSDDDAPEAVANSVGLNQARTVRSEAQWAAQRQKGAEKEKRRKRDAHLKIQAKAAKRKTKTIKSPLKQNPAAVMSAADQKTADHLDSITKALLDSTSPLPDLLPDELLQSESRKRTTESITTTLKSSKTRKFLVEDSKPPKDIQRGNIHIRVLEDLKMALPPRPSVSSKNLRKNWLAGTGSRASRRRVAWGKKPFVVAKRTPV